MSSLRRQRRPRGWSFPLGAEMLSDVLGAVPYAAPEPLWFSHSEPMWLKDRRIRESKDLPLPVLKAEFTTWALGIETKPERPLWRIDVGSVQTPLRHCVRSCLIAEGLPRIRRWLLQPFAETALDGEPRCRVRLQADQKRLTWEERASQFTDARLEELRCGS